jgi:pyruvate dehydrogenase E1 component alpha subunit
MKYSPTRMAEAKAEDQQQGQTEPHDGPFPHAEDDRSPEERLPVDPGEHHDLPDREHCEEILRKMLLIRRFEERAGEMYTKAAIGGFLHLAIGEEAAIVGATLAMRDTDFLISTYREHGQALARGTDPRRVMAELFGRQDGVSKGHGGSMHLFDIEKRFMGGYGIVGGNLPLAVGLGLASDYQETDDVTVCMLGDGAINQGNFGESLNLAALWSLPIVFLVVNNQFGMGTAIERASAITDLSKRGDGFGVPGARCNGMDVLDTKDELEKALRKAREERTPQLVEAVTYRFRGHSMADPEEYRSKEEVEEWRRRDPITTFGERVKDEDVLSQDDIDGFDEEAQSTVEEAVEFATQSPFPDLDALYDDLYAYSGDEPGWYVVDERAPETHKGEDLREHSSDAMRELAEAGAAYAKVGDAEERRKRPDPDEGEEPSSGPRDEEGGGD